MAGLRAGKEDGWGGWGGENEEVAGVRLGVGGRDGAGAGAGGESWAMESQTKSWLRLVLSRKRMRAEAAAGWCGVGTCLRPMAVGIERVRPIDRSVATYTAL